MRGLADGLDADTSFLTPAEVTLVERRPRPSRAQVGLELTRQYYLRVIAARDGSPAAQARVSAPATTCVPSTATPTRHMSLFEGTRRLRGAVGSKVTLTVLRGQRDRTARAHARARALAPAES